jgi:glycosyltransferase involved in cell wall biosynthesis
MDRKTSVMVKLSVCITTYKRAKLLNNTLISLAAQTRLPDELIISDDCSPDSTPEVVEKWSKTFKNLRYNRNTNNLNMPGNLNAAISLATGEYVANLHDADEFAPSLLEDWEKALDKYSSAGFVFCGASGVLNQTGSGDGIIVHDVSPITPGREFFEKYFSHRLTSIVWGTVMARHSAYRRLLPFDKAFGFVSDVDMWMRMCLHYDVAYVRKPLLILDNSPTNERNPDRFRWNWLDNARKMQEVNIKRFYEDQPHRLKQEMRRHRLIVRWIYAKRILGRLRHFDWNGLYEGLMLCRNFYWPMKLTGKFKHD